MEAIEPELEISNYTCLTDFEEVQVCLPSGTLLFDGQERQVTLFLPESSMYYTSYEEETESAAFSRDGVELDRDGFATVFFNTVCQEGAHVNTEEDYVNVQLKEKELNQTTAQLFDSLENKLPLGLAEDVFEDVTETRFKVIEQTENSITRLVQLVFDDFVASITMKTFVKEDCVLELSHIHFGWGEFNPLESAPIYQSLPSIQLKG